MDIVGRLGERFAATLYRIATVLEDAGWPFAVIGASAFLLHGIDLRRTTRDLDLAVAIEGGLDAVRPILLDAGLSSTGIEHRFKMPDGSEIDVLAIDPGWSPQHEIRLADGDRIQAVGLPDAVRAAVPVEIDGRRVPVAPLSTLIAVKLYAATTAHRSHDLEDACEAMNAYENSGPRRFDVEYDRFTSLTLETAGAFLAGMDAGRAVEPSTRATIAEAIGTLLDFPTLTDRFADGETRRALVLAYREGLRVGGEREVKFGGEFGPPHTSR